MDKLRAAANLRPSESTRPTRLNVADRLKIYEAEKKVIGEEFKALGNNINWNDSAVQAKLRDFSKKVIEVVQFYMAQEDLVEQLIPSTTVDPGDTLIHREIHGINVYNGTYGDSVRMNRPQFTEYSGKPTPKECGIDLDLTLIRTGKYSPTEIADYATGVITSWRNRLLFVNTLAAMTQYQSGGAQYKVGPASFATMDAIIDCLTDEADVKVIVGRRSAIHKLSNMSGWSDTAKDQFQMNGQVGKYGGIPVVKVNSFTDPDYGVVHPMLDTDLWLFSELPAGRLIFADRLNTAEETVLRRKALNIFMWWDDVIKIWWANRIARVASLT